MSKCFGMFDHWIREVPVIGFNSAKYDWIYVYLCDALKKYDFVFDKLKINKISKL